MRRPVLLALGLRKREIFCGNNHRGSERSTSLEAIRLYRNRWVNYWFACHVLKSGRPASAVCVFDDIWELAERRRPSGDLIE